MCRFCALVQQCRSGAIECVNMGYFIVCDDPLTDPENPTKLFIHKFHTNIAMQMFLNTMTETAEEMYPNHRFFYNMKNPPEHLYFKMIPKTKKKEE